MSHTERCIVELMRRELRTNKRITRMAVLKLIAAIERGDHLFLDRWSKP